MSKNRILYENNRYNIKQIEDGINHHIPNLLHTGYYDGMVVMPKCKCFVTLATVDIPPVLRAFETSGYVALIRESYKSRKLKKGCVVRVLDYQYIDSKNEILQINIEGIKRFICYENSKIQGYDHELIKPDYTQFEKDNLQNPIPIDFNTLEPIFIQFFMQFLGIQSMDSHLDLSAISLDKFLNSLIMIMPITDTERLYLSEIPSLHQRQEALSLILNCTFNGLTSHYEYH